uniref:Uncharacterized protein n=1 Tax=Siphoviridae sp. ctnPP24 TaxID=2825662 RepID=A0A8S5TZ48_9CAUD|nr:MAG TPA: hypothetical protein [Siphoviridae sp. ctnPP24]
MNELEVRMRVQALAKDMIDDFMARNGVSATAMVDALNSVLVGLYPKVQSEMLRAADMDAAAKAQQQAQQQAQIVNPAEQKATPKEKEVK